MRVNLSFRRALLILAAICLITRLGFIFGQKQLPVMWDARIYSSAALGIIHVMSDGGNFGHPENLTPEDSARSVAEFRNLMNKHISGEQIQWLYYPVPSIRQAQEYIFISGPLYPLWLAALFWATPAEDFMVARIMNTFLDTLSLILMLIIAYTLFGLRTAVFAGVLYIIYLPFVLLTGMISTDQMTICLLLLSIYLTLRWYESKKSKFVYLLGLTSGLLILTKPTATFLFLLFGIALLYESSISLRERLRVLKKAALPFVAVVLPWFIGASLYFGTAAIRDPRYSEANFRSSSSIKYEGYDLDFAEKDFWLYRVSYTIRKDPVGYAKLLVKKLVRLWGQPYNDFKQSFFVRPGGAAVIHLLIILTGVFGIWSFIIYKGRGLILLALIPLYYTGVHIVFHSLARYNLNAMPIVMVASAFVLSGVFEFVRRRHLVSRKWFFPTVGLLLFATLYFLLVELPYMVAIVGQAGVAINAAVGLVIITSLFAALYHFLRQIYPARRVIIFLLPPYLFLGVVQLVWGAAPDRWAEWVCRLTKPTEAALVDIYIPKEIRLLPNESVRLWLDMRSLSDAGKNLSIAIDDQTFEFSHGKPPLSRFYYNKSTYRIFEGLGALTKDNMRYWSYVPFAAEAFNYLAEKRGYIRVLVSPSNSISDFPNQIELFGNFPCADNDEALIPDLERSSIERYVEKGDPRVWVKYPLSSDSAKSYYIADMRDVRLLSDDLSPQAGRQNGRYRIYIEARRADESYLYF